MSSPPEGRLDPHVLRRPSELARAPTPAPGQLRRRPEPPHDGWPVGFVQTSRDRDALLVLLGLASLTPRRLLDAARSHGSFERCLRAVRRGLVASPRDQEAARSADAGAVAGRLDASGARMAVVHDPEYPAALGDLFDPPAAIFIRGRDLRDLEPSVAMVGARNCSAAGREIAIELARALGAAGISVVSGAARGIDAAAHRGALLGGAGTIAVLGSGIDVAYPRQHARLLDDITNGGAVVSEYPPGIRAEPFRFPARNRLVAALASAIVVVEGAPGSGSMITADHALEIGRDVFAVPGSVSSELAAVPLALIREGAGLIRGPHDLLSDLGLRPPAPEGKLEERPFPGASDRDVVVWAAVGSCARPDEVARSAGISLPEAMASLVALELRGLIRAVGGRYERRSVRRGD